MNKSDLVKSISQKASIKGKDAEKALNAFMDTIQETIKTGEKVILVGFGTFEARERKERTGRNPSTKEEILIPASKSPIFKAGKALKDSVNK